MARPKKTADGIDARQRICDALWILLEKRELREITVGMITTQANCNRGTFYYHFKDIDDLLDAVIADDVMQPSVIAELIFRASTGDEESITNVLTGDHMRRLSIVVNRAGIEIAFKKVFEMLVGIWSSILCPEGDSVKPETQAVILYYVGGMLSMIATIEPSDLEKIAMNPSLTRFMASNTQYVVAQICMTQGVSKEVAKDRISTVVQFMESIH